MRVRRVLLATRSRGKLGELRPMFERVGLEVVDLNDLGVAESEEENVLEAFESFEENALAKGRYFHRLTNGMPTVADDSGLEVYALGGAPGVRSKRWSGRSDVDGTALDEANNARLLAELRGVTDRRGRYVCVAAFVNDGREVIRRGEVEGEILDAPRGAGGFGYDPVFFSPELGQTFAEVARSEKERVSHRGRAFRGLLDALGGDG